MTVNWSTFNNSAFFLNMVCPEMDLWITIMATKTVNALTFAHRYTRLWNRKRFHSHRPTKHIYCNKSLWAQRTRVWFTLLSYYFLVVNLHVYVFKHNRKNWNDLGCRCLSYLTKNKQLYIYYAKFTNSVCCIICCRFMCRWVFQLTF